VQHVAIGRLPDQPAHDDPTRLHQPTGPIDRTDPAAVAAALVIAGLADQDLEVVDLGVDTLAIEPTAASVRVAATHRPPTAAAAAHTSVYELDLTREPNGAWQLAGFRQTQ
jgi:hypothetical protein